MEFRREKPPSSSLWIFGYGSLIWNPGFQYKTSRNGFVRGFSRRFWQGNIVHRGTPAKPGRVVTLTEDAESLAWGKAFELADESALAAVEYLTQRETALGGYRTQIVTFEPIGCEDDASFPVLLYMATSDNQFYLGPAPMHEMANQITDASGECGHNVEYLLRLAEFMHEELPGVYDEHLFTLECLVRSRLKEKNINVKGLMPEGEAGPEARVEAEGERAANEAEAPRPSNFQFTATVPPKKLRCLKV